MISIGTLALLSRFAVEDGWPLNSVGGGGMEHDGEVGLLKRFRKPMQNLLKRTTSNRRT